jgi:signal transduction histidine kinase
MLLVSQLIREEWPKQAAPVPTQDFEAVQKAGQELGTLISALLDFSSLEAGRLSLEMAPFNTAHCLANFESLYRSLAQQKGLVFEMALGPGLPEWLLGDSQRLCQVTKELLSNAIKFTDRGKVMLKADWKSSASALRLEVTDTGPGISAAGRKLIFQPFEQADGSLTRRHGGSGLGLAIAKRIVDLMGGRIDFESEPGKGSRFWVEVPLKKAVADPD